ncbi:TSCPD domain-containing protein [Bradyrhizobium sp. USDA 10063]
MAERRALPMRRFSETFELLFGGLARGYVVTMGFYHDGTVGEIFVNGGKSGEAVEAIARDGAVVLSLALQHGVPLDTISHAITRDGQGAPSSIIGAVVDRLTGDQP